MLQYQICKKYITVKIIEINLINFERNFIGPSVSMKSKQNHATFGHSWNHNKDLAILCFYRYFNSSYVGTYEMIACARLQKVFLCYYAAWYVPYHSDPFKNPFEDYMIDLIYPELDLPWCISLWSGVLLFILHQITFIFWYKDWGQESAFCTGQLRLQISRREHVFWIDIYGGGW